MQTSDLRFEHGAVHLDVGETSYLSPGVGAHRLTIPIWLSADGLVDGGTEHTTAALLTGDVAVTGRPLAAIAPMALTLRQYRTAENLRVSLGDEQLVDLGQLAGGEVVLGVTVKLVLLNPPDGAHPVAETYFDHRIEAYRWNELLDQLGTHVALFLRVPAPQPLPADEGESASLAKAARRLREARDRLRDGQWENSVATCRRALDHLAALVSIPGEHVTGAITPQNRDEEQRWAMLYHAVRDIGHAAHHDDGTTATFRWTRADAEAVLATTGALLARYSDPSTVTVARSDQSPDVADGPA